MIPERLSQSIANCRTWLARRARLAPGRVRRTENRRRGTRPELFVLEDRCLLTTASYVINSSSIAFDKISTSISASAIAEAMEYASSQPAVSNRVLVMVMTGSAEFPLGIIGYGSLTQNAATGSYILNFEAAMEMPSDFPSTPTASKPPGGVFVIIPPVPSNPPPPVQAPSPPDSSRAIAWWSQTPHPTTGVVLILANPNGAVSSLPPAQASSPVVLFLLNVPAAAEASPSRQIGDVNVLDRASDMFAMAASKTGMTDRNMTAWITRNLTTVHSGPPEVDEIFSQNALAVAPVAPLPVPTKSELLALTDKILEEYAPLSKKTEEPKDVISLQAVAACAAVQTAWLLLRHVATTRSKASPGDLEPKRGWSWKAIR